MKRRNFVQSLLVVPAATVAAEQATPPATQQPQATPVAPRPSQNLRGGPQNVPQFKLVQPDAAAEPVTGFFNPSQFAVLNKLAEIMVPPMKNNPGALDAHAPEFLDFLISRSPTPSQSLYRNGLEGLDAAAKQRFQKSFAELDAREVDAIIRPLLVARPWEREEPKDAMQRFIAQVHDDLRTATMNSAEWAASPSTSGRSRFNSGRRMYWKPIDPRVGA